MVQSSLVSYINKQLDLGYKLEDIKNFLKNSGYNSQEVDNSAEYVYNSKYNPEIAKKQRIDQLIIYIQQQQRAGFFLPQIKQFLLKNNYLENEVNSAISAVESPQKKENNYLGVVLVMVFVMSMIIGGMVMWNFQLGQDISSIKLNELLDLKAKKLTNNPVAGESLDFQVEIFNMGSSRRYDIVLDYVIKNRDTNEIISGESETFALDTSLSKILSIDIPKNTPGGKYILEIDANYDDLVAKAGFIFDIESKKIIDEVKSSLNKNNISSSADKKLDELDLIIKEQQEKVEKIETPKKIVSTPSNDQYDKLSKADKFSLIENVSLSNELQAVDMCNDFVYDTTKRDCIINIVEFKDNYKLCAYLENSVDSDGCYFKIFMTADTIDCSVISNEEMKKSCNVISSSKNLLKQYNVEVPDVKSYETI